MMRTMHAVATAAVVLALACLAVSGGHAVAGSGDQPQLVIKKRTGDEIGWNVAGNGTKLGQANVTWQKKKDRLRVKVALDASDDDELENEGRLEIRTKQWYDKPGKPYSAEDRADYWEDEEMKTGPNGEGKKTFTVRALNEKDGKIFVQLNVRRKIGPPVWTRPSYASDAVPVTHE